MQKATVSLLTFFLLCTVLPQTARSAEQTFNGPFGRSEWKDSTIPLRPGVPGQSPFWNTYAKRFIFAPAFNFKTVQHAAKYRFEIVSLEGPITNRFEDKVPYAPLSPVWASVPVGTFTIKVTGLSSAGDALGVAGEGKYFRAAPFDGPYLQPVMPYDQSGRLALDKVMHKPEVEYWLDHKVPDPNHYLYRYPAKLFGSLVVGSVAHARVNAGTDAAKRSTEQARIIADYLISISFPEGRPLEFFPPTYHGATVGTNAKSHMQLNNYIIIAAAESGHGYLDLYDLTGDKKYLEAAQRIARTYLKTQLKNGSWWLYVNHETGEPTADKIAIPTAIIVYLERLKNDYHMPGLDDSIQRAFTWIMENPVKTFDWTSQYEDVSVKGAPPYKKMSREQACDLAIYLFKHYPREPKYVALAEDLIRFAEDQFITWEQMEDLVVHNGAVIRPAANTNLAAPGWYSKNWLLPIVHEQYDFWMPSARNTGLMIQTYWAAYTATKKDVYLAKAKSIANNFTRVQQLHDGEYPTFFTKYPMQLWLNNSIYPAIVMMQFQKDLEQSGKVEKK